MNITAYIDSRPVSPLWSDRLSRNLEFWISTYCTVLNWHNNDSDEKNYMCVNHDGITLEVIKRVGSEKKSRLTNWMAGMIW